MGRILIIDDDQTAERLRVQVSALGHKVAIASDAYTGLTAATREPSDLIMIGLNLPGGGGAKMLERLRGNTGTAATPVIFVFELRDGANAVSNDQRVRFLQKPTDADTLKVLVEELLPPPPAPSAEAAAVEPDEDGSWDVLPPAPSQPGRTMPMDMGAPSDDDITPGETIELD
jgi:DNA-binding response OmpR family regulator